MNRESDDLSDMPPRQRQLAEELYAWAIHHGVVLVAVFHQLDGPEAGKATTVVAADIESDQGAIVKKTIELLKRDVPRIEAEMLQIRREIGN